LPRIALIIGVINPAVAEAVAFFFRFPTCIRADPIHDGSYDTPRPKDSYIPRNAYSTHWIDHNRLRPSFALILRTAKENRAIATCADRWAAVNHTQPSRSQTHHTQVGSVTG